MLRDFQADGPADEERSGQSRFPNPDATCTAPSIDHDERWEQARWLLHDESLDLTDRVAGSLVLLNAQPLSRVVQLKVEQLERSDGRLFLRFGNDPVEMPEPLGSLILRLNERQIWGRKGRAAIGAAESPWLFNGLRLGRPVSTVVLRKRLLKLGIIPRRARTAALMHLATQVPVPILADLLNIHPNTATKWVRLAAGEWTAYASFRSGTRR